MRFLFLFRGMTQYVSKMEPCPNWRLCGKMDSYCGIRCGNCYIMFNKTFEFTQDEIECSVCYEETTDNIKLPCDHLCCVKCIKRIVYGRNDIPEPEYPYPDEQEEPTQEQWETDPKLIEFNRLLNTHDLSTQPHPSWGDCPICRASFKMTNEGKTR
jgi:hypothetical protein